MSRRVRVKPGKGQSMTGFLGGLIFCFIGLFIVVPTFGIFGVVWTLFAVIITVTNGINAFSNKGIATHEIIIDNDDNKDIEDHIKSPEKRLIDLQRLYEKGIITDMEYQEKRKQILEEL